MREALELARDFIQYNTGSSHYVIEQIDKALAQPEQGVIPLNIEDSYVRSYLWDRALIAVDDPCARSHPHEDMGEYCRHKTELAHLQAKETST